MLESDLSVSSAARDRGILTDAASTEESADASKVRLRRAHATVCALRRLYVVLGCVRVADVDLTSFSPRLQVPTVCRTLCRRRRKKELWKRTTHSLSIADVNQVSMGLAVNGCASDLARLRHVRCGEGFLGCAVHHVAVCDTP